MIFIDKYYKKIKSLFTPPLETGRNSWIFVLILVALLSLGVGLRAFRYWEFPVVGETQDEVAWMMLGGSLLQTGTPQSWSFFNAYKDVREVSLGSTTFNLVSPAVDHPPLFSLVPGAAITLSGLPWDQLASSKITRLPMVLIGSLNVLLLGVWASRIWGRSVRTVVAVGLMSTVPSFVFLSRLVVSENLLIMWFLLSLLGLSYIKYSWARFLLILSIFALPLTKISGLALGIGLIVGSYKMVELRDTKVMLLALMSGIGGLFAYMAFFDFSLFWQVQFGQAGRDVGFMTAYITQLSLPTLVAKLSTDLWIWLGYISVLIHLFLPPRDNTEDRSWWRIMMVVFIAQFAFVMFSVGEHTVHGWYRIVFIPVFVYSWAVLAQKLWDTVQWIALSGVLLLVSFVPRGVLRGSVPTSEFWEIQSVFSRLWVLFCGIPVIADIGQNMWPKQFPWKKAWQMLLVGIFVIVLASHVITVVTMTKEIYWADELYLKSGIQS